jgi:hypothetical protein
LGEDLGMETGAVSFPGAAGVVESGDSGHAFLAIAGYFTLVAAVLAYSVFVGFILRRSWQTSRIGTLGLFVPMPVLIVIVLAPRFIYL